MLRLRHRQRFRRKEATALVESIKNMLGVEIAGTDEPIESADADGWILILVRGKAVAFNFEGKPFLTVKGLLLHTTNRLFVTVDMGAVKYVCNGADVMCPGIVDADSAINVDDFVWVRDVRNKQPLAVGKALVSGAEMVTSKTGKGVKTLHYVGDKLWKLDE